MAEPQAGPPNKEEETFMGGAVIRNRKPPAVNWELKEWGRLTGWAVAGEEETFLPPGGVVKWCPGARCSLPAGSAAGNSAAARAPPAGRATPF